MAFEIETTRKNSRQGKNADKLHINEHSLSIGCRL